MLLQVKVRRRGSEAKFIAKVLAQGPECDIGVPSISEITWSKPRMLHLASSFLQTRLQRC